MAEGLEHRGAADEVEGADAVNGEHCEGRVLVALDLQRVRQGLCARTGCQGILMGFRGKVEGRTKLLCEGPGNQTQEVTNNDAPYTARRLAHGNEAPQAMSL